MVRGPHNVVAVNIIERKGKERKGKEKKAVNITGFIKLKRLARLGPRHASWLDKCSSYAPTPMLCVTIERLFIRMLGHILDVMWVVLGLRKALGGEITKVPNSTSKWNAAMWGSNKISYALTV